MIRKIELFGFLLLVVGCATTPRILTAETCPSEPRPAVLIRNDVAPPAWVWVAEDEIPTTARTILFGKKGEVAPPEVVATWSPPPCGVPVSRLHTGITSETQGAEGWTILGALGVILQTIGRGLR